ncbi:MAG: hypothetical protein ISR73_13505 [Gammaproteobacteria bacterium]|nr:hypothetical protein [Gammaproteobacteria bacterium]
MLCPSNPSTIRERIIQKTLLALAISAASIANAAAQDLSISMTNQTHGSHFTPKRVQRHRLIYRRWRKAVKPAA